MTPAQRALAEIARAETARVYGTACPEHRQPAFQPEQERPADTYYGPAAQHERQALVEALSPVRLVRDRVPRKRIEQAIARSEWNDDKIAAELRVRVDDVQAVRAAMDRLSA